MTDQRLRELLHDTAGDPTSRDLAGPAWEAGVRARRRRTTGVVAAAAAVTVVAGGAIALGTRGAPRTQEPVGPATSSVSPTSSPEPTLTTARGNQPDAHYGGDPVWWSPTLVEEADLPWADSLLPHHVDLSDPAPQRHVDYALAAYAVMDDGELARFVVVGPDGTPSLLDVSRVQPLLDADGNVVGPFAPTMLSPTGRYLLFPQQHDLLVYDLTEDHWITLGTRGAPTEWAKWGNDDQVWLPSDAEGGRGPLVRIDGTHGGVQVLPPPRGPLGPDAMAYGRSRNGPTDDAQSWFATDDFPVPPGGIRPPQVLVVGNQGGPSRVLEMTDLGGERQKGCCTVQFWLDQHAVAYDSGSSVIAWTVGTHDFRRVTEIGGYDADREGVVGSYVRVWNSRLG